jgi:hypothetical protein
VTRDRLVSVFVALTAVALVVLVWVLTHRHERTVVQEERPQTTVLVEPPRTPLPRDSGPKNNARSRKARNVGSARGQANVQPRTLAKPQNRPLSPRGRRKAKTPRTTRPHRHRPVYTPPARGSPPPPSQRPPVDVQVPAPLTVCVRPAGGVNCP